MATSALFPILVLCLLLSQDCVRTFALLGEPLRPIWLAIDSYSLPPSSSSFASTRRSISFVRPRTALLTTRAVVTATGRSSHRRSDNDVSVSRRTLFSVSTKYVTINFIAASSLLLHDSNSPANATIIEPRTGIVFPSEGEIEHAIPSQQWNDDLFCLEDDKATSFARLDSTPDSVFYSKPRFVEHVDDHAVQTLTSYISDKILKDKLTVLDLCCSWTSHISPVVASKLERISGLGMNEQELKSNMILTDFVVMDLNANNNNDEPVKLPYEEDTFDVVLCQLSIDYLIHPLEVMKEVGRVLRPEGQVVIIFSNRIFLQKAVGLWTGADDIDHAYIVGSYLRCCNGGFENIQAKDLSTRKSGRGKDRLIIGDPIYAVSATKQKKTEQT